MRKFFFRFSVLLLCIVVNGAAWFAFYVYSPAPGTGKVTIVVPRGAGVRQIQGILADNSIIRNDIRFLAMVRLLAIKEKGVRMRAGEFTVPLNLTPLQVVRFLETAKPVQYRVTVPEGRTVEQIAAIFSRDNWIDSTAFLALTNNKEFIQKLGIEADSLEGYLFPETYTLVRGEVDEQSLIRSMTDNFKSVWNQLIEMDQQETNTDPADSEKSGQKKVKKKPAEQYNRHQLLTLASIVEKETGSAGERDVIAAVFYNRLRRGMRLQSDPTTIYGIKDFNGNLTRADLKEKTAYNTYVIAGLPPGPICNPGRAALQAVLQPADVSYLYFVSKNNGSHYFSKTLKEHNRAVYKFQKNKKSRQAAARQ
jgi:UPF0755 protein